MPGRRVSRHSKAKTFPCTVAVPIFKFSSRIGPGLALMAFPISTFPAGLLFPTGAARPEKTAAALRLLVQHLFSRCETIGPPNSRLELLNLSLCQRELHL